MAPEIYIKYSASVNDKVPQESAIASESVCVCCVCASEWKQLLFYKMSDYVI